MLTKIKSKLLLTEPFFGYLLLKLKFIEDESVKTMGVDGIHFWYAPSFVKNESTEHLLADVIHELMHCVLMHPTRGFNHNKEISNYAADYVVNDYIRNKTDFILQSWALYDPRFQNMSYEAVYKILFDECKGKPDPKLMNISKKQGSFSPMPKSAVEPETGLPLEDFWISSIQEAGDIVKATGKPSTQIQEELLNSIVPPQLPWEKLLNRFCVKNIKLNSSWNRPNRRFIHQGIYLPTYNFKGLERLVGAVDTSCSVNNIQFQHMIAEFNKILINLKPELLTILHCDDKIAKVESFTKKDYPITTTMMGRGMTAFEPVFKHVEEEKLKPNCLIYFTDLEGDFNFNPPPYPVLWINTSPYNKYIAPFGTTIKMKV